MTNGQKIAAEALRHLGIVERPWDSNTGEGVVNASQAMYGMGPGTRLGPQPWCACFVAYCYRRAGVSHDGVIHPHTGTMCVLADQKGGMKHRGGPVPAGALAIRCGVHVEIVIADRGNGLLDCIGGNVNQGVRRTVRALSDWRVIVPPEILKGEPQPIRVFWFEDPHLRPERHGPWRTKEERTDAIARLNSNMRRRVRLVNLGGETPYAFEVLKSGGRPWQFGSWRSKEARDRVMERRESKTQRQMRPRSKLIAAPEVAGSATGGVTVGDTVT